MRYKYNTIAGSDLMRVGVVDALARALTVREADDLADTIALTVRQAQGRHLTMPAAGLTPVPSLWQGERKYTALNFYSQAPEFRKFDSGVVIDRRHVLASAVPVLDLKVQELALQFLRANEREVVSVLANGNTLVTFDGQPLLTATGRGVVNANLTTAPLTLESLQAAYTQMLGFQMDGQPAPLRPTHLLVGPRNYLNALELTESTTVVIRGSTDTVRPAMNAIGGKLQVLVSEWLTGAWANYWFLLSLDSPFSRPVVRGLRGQDNNVDFEVVVADDPTRSDDVLDKDVIKLTLLFEGAFAPFDWRAVVGGLAT